MQGKLVARADKVAFFGILAAATATTAVTGTGVTAATVDLNVFKTKVVTSGDTVFKYNVSQWEVAGAAVTLAEYGVVATGVPVDGDTITVSYTAEKATYHRMQGFTDMSKSLNPKEYSRQYVDEYFEQTDVVGFSPSIAYGFDQYKGNAVHDELVKLSDNEAIGTDAVRTIVIVDFTKETANTGEYLATAREFSVIPDSEGGSMDAYTYSGTFKVKGDKIEGTATSTDDWQTLEFVQA